MAQSMLEHMHTWKPLKTFNTSNEASILALLKRGEPYGGEFVEVFFKVFVDFMFFQNV